LLKRCAFRTQEIRVGIRWPLIKRNGSNEYLMRETIAQDVRLRP